MMAFKDRSWAARFAEMGDLAESKFEEHMNKIRRGYTRYGLARPPIAVNRLPARVRYTPDYLTSSAFVEVQGFGADQTIKLKIDKWGALHWWADVFPVDLFLYDSHNDRHRTINLHDLTKLLASGKGTLAQFAEGKSYFAFRAEDLFS
jgi:hypothetical protein